MTFYYSSTAPSRSFRTRSVMKATCLEQLCSLEEQNDEVSFCSCNPFPIFAPEPLQVSYADRAGVAMNHLPPTP